jgi:hypothetical protein
MIDWIIGAVAVYTAYKNKDKIKQNFKDWQQHSKNKIEKEHADGIDTAGRRGEEFLRNLMVNHRNFGGTKNCLCLPNKRIPKLDGQGKREIDLILVTQKKIHIYEVKNWSGRIEGRIDDPKWIHHPSYGGEPREVDNLIIDNESKANLIISFLNYYGYDVSQEQIEHKTIFVDNIRPNGDVRLHLPNDIKNNKFVITSEKLNHYLDIEQAGNVDRYDFWQNMILKFIEFVITRTLGEEYGDRFIDGISGRVGKERYKKLLEDLKLLPTWDQLMMYGTKIYSGDIIDHYGFHEDWKNMFIDAGGIDFSKIEEIHNTTVYREPDQKLENKLKSLGKSLIRGYMPLKAKGRYIYSPLSQFRGNPYYKLKFLPAGGVKDQNGNLLIETTGKLKPLEIPILKINQILYGNKYANEKWLFNQL